MKTAVEWLVDEMIQRKFFEKETELSYTTLEHLTNQAKEMEKEQLIDCGNSCAMKQHIHIERVNDMTMDEMLEFSNEETLTFGEQYYNETFKQ